MKKKVYIVTNTLRTEGDAIITRNEAAYWHKENAYAYAKEQNDLNKKFSYTGGAYFVQEMTLVDFVSTE